MNIERANKVLREAVGDLGGNLDEGRRGKKDGVSKAFYKYFENIQIDLMAIPRVYKDIEAVLASGKDIDKAMKGLVQKYKQSTI